MRGYYMAPERKIPYDYAAVDPDGTLYDFRTGKVRVTATYERRKILALPPGPKMLALMPGPPTQETT
jgi:hypothetical protein